MPPGLMFFLTLLVLILSIIHDPAYGGLRGRRHFYQIVSRVKGLSEGLLSWHDAKLLAIRADDANFPNPDFSIYAQFNNDRTPRLA